MKNFLFTIGLLVITIALWRLVSFIYQLIDDQKTTISKNIRRALGVKPHKSLIELLIIKYVCYFIILCIFIISFMSIWGISVNLIDTIVDGLVKGFSITGLVINPARIAIALVVFSLMILCGRFIATMISRKYKFDNEEDTQVAVASIIMYVTFAFALLLGLLITGVDFTGLAIITGALSVGVGLGLQSIVNNFFSGVILLFEQSLQPGDRVLVGNIEGFIKKIRIRSTQITIPGQGDVIIPNADLLSTPVTNYMFSDRRWRIFCQVGVDYGSDTNLVKEVLLKVASEHKEVVQDKSNKPAVLFRSFGDSRLNFELSCVIYDINKKYTIISDLNFAIDRVFRENNIKIAFPQRDVHIYNEQ